MTDKRFSKYVPDSYGYSYVVSIVDYETGNYSGSIDDFVDLLNELHEEKEQLQSRINDYDVALKTLQDLTERKLKENEQLKFQLDECRSHKLFSRRELERENKELRKRVMILQDKVNGLMK